MSVGSPSISGGSGARTLSAGPGLSSLTREGMDGLSQTSSSTSRVPSLFSKLSCLSASTLSSNFEGYMALWSRRSIPNPALCYVRSFGTFGQGLRPLCFAVRRI